MRKLIYLASIIVLCFFSADLSASERLQEELRDAAHENIRNLSPGKRSAYRALLAEYDDKLIYFLVASEEEYKLEMADISAIESHYRHIRERQWELYEEYGPEFFFSHIAKITVTHELITPYRETFAGYGLHDLAALDDVRERVRELNLWCRRMVAFRATSARPQTPADMLERSNLGRCEELLIFFISAARSVGIPARPAYTPLWPHTDGNHAWVEVFVDGEWEYLGAAEPEYELSRAWFSSNIDKALMILARSSFPDDSGLDLMRTGPFHIINSTPNYACPVRGGLRRVSFELLDEDLDPVDNAVMVLHLFNRGRLRPLLRMPLAGTNSLALDMGSGSFLATAESASSRAMVHVPEGGEDRRVRLVLGERIVGGDHSLRYPGMRDVEEGESAPAGWEERVEDARRAYDELVLSYATLPDMFQVPEGPVEILWERFRNNSDALERFYLEHSPEEEFLWHLTLLDEKSLWQVSPQQLENIYRLFLEARAFRVDLPPEVMAVVLEPGIFMEALSESPPEERFLAWRGLDAREAALAINDFLAGEYEIDARQAVRGVLPVEKLIDKEFLNLEQYKTLLCHLLRHNFIPARYSRNPDTVLVHVEGRWRDLDFLDNVFPAEVTEEDAVEVSFAFVDEEYRPIILDEDRFVLSTYDGGVFYPYQAEAIRQGRQWRLSLPRDEFYLQVGYRVSDERTEFKLVPMDTRRKDGLYKELVLRDYPVRWEGITEDVEPLRSIASGYISGSARDKVFLFGEPDSEPVQRMADRIRSVIGEEKFYWIGGRRSPHAADEYLADEEYSALVEERDALKDVVITIHYDRRGDNWSSYRGEWERLPL